MPSSNSYSNRMILISSSTALLLASLASFYFIYNNKKKRPETSIISSIKGYFNSSSSSSKKKTTVVKEQQYKVSESKQSAEFKRKREIIEKSLNRKLSIVDKPTNNVVETRPSHHLIGHTFSRAQRPAKTSPSKTRLNQNMSSSTSIVLAPNNETKNNELYSALEQLTSACNSLLKKGDVTFQPDASCQKDIFGTIDIVLDDFIKLDLSRKTELSANLSSLSSLDFFKTSFPSIIKLINILLSHYSINTNENLFEKYMFNNTVGEISTLIVENFLNVFVNLLETKENLKKCLEFNTPILNLLHSYIVDLDKNKNNVKRSAKIKSIKLASIRALKSILGYFKSEINEPNVREMGARFVRILGKCEAIHLPDINLKSANNQVNRSSRDSIESRMELLEAYLQLVVRYLQLVVEFEIKDMNEETSNQFYNYLISYKFYSALDYYFRASNTAHLIDSMNELFKLLLYIKENFIVTADSESSSEFEKISIEV